ncbi:MAM and LDL-receptor class A domain-containing protein 1 isoform X2 [Mobula hypostoma]|uniref:MAM and LDL-receptor class A domain-containing protein 1 isoform X2 n=1 Tax=Mobula hypostoma TaxID=723540 RepID=UPI002FC2F507
MNKIGKTLFRLFLVTFLVVKPDKGADLKWSRRSCVPPGNACNFTDNKNDQECPWYESCDFETDFCNWSNDLESETQWTRRNSLSGIGPLNDHKGNLSAYYLSISPERNSKDFAVLRSAVFLPPKDICQMSFYYQFGHVSGMLKVGLYQQNSGHILEIWNQTSAQGSQWNRKVIKINSKGKYQVIIQGIIFDYTPSNEGIAIDDITFNCGCLTRPDPACDFEADLCGWHSEEIQSSVAWQHIQSGNSSGIGSAPPMDHSTESSLGHYVWIEANNITSSQTALLSSSVYRDSGQHCRFEFFYQINGRNVLTVLLQTKEGQVNLWEEWTPTENQWIKGEVWLPPCLSQFQVIFAASIQSKAGFLALDSLRFHECEMEYFPESCSPSTFTCGTGHCIPLSSVCDFQADCCDGRDEDESVCSKYTMCNFESGFCEWKHLTSEGGVWVRGQGPTSGLPVIDHTTNSSQGMFLYFKASEHKATNIIQIGSPELKNQLNNDLPCQVRFWYQMSEGANMSIYIRTTAGNMERVITLTTPVNRVWTKLEIPVELSITQTMKPFQVILQSTVLAVRNAFIAIDDVSLTPGCAISHRMASNSITEYKASTCNFEEDSCGWFENVPNDNFDWIRNSSSALPSNVKVQAPARDHTTNATTGHFMFILTMKSNIFQTAELTSPKFTQSGTGCTMSFWYYNYGLAVGAAKMFLEVEGVKNNTVVWWTYNTQSNQWLQGFVQLGRLTRPFHLKLVKVSLGIYNGVAAVDDIVFANCSLPPAVEICEGAEWFWCEQTRACINRLQVCDLVDDCGDGSDEINCEQELLCNFENGFCNWQQAKDDDFDWTRNKGQTSTANTGPSKDHTLGTAEGHYLYIEASDQQFGNTATLLSPILDATSNHANKTCIFRFHFHMFGKQIFKLAVYKRTHRNTNGDQLWVKYGQHGDRWLKEILFINSSEPFQVLVKGTVGDNLGGDIGIDDISFMNCELYSGDLPAIIPTTTRPPRPSTVPPNNCTVNEFVCITNGQCVAISKKCDFREDCSDKTDELFCVWKFCNFSNGVSCGWKQQVEPTPAKNVFQWFSGQGSDIHPGEEGDRPSMDHTMGTEQGWYLYADSSNGKFGHSADIFTPEISLTGPKCKLVFWYHMSGATIGSLQVFIKFGNITQLLWSQSGSQGNHWRRGEIFLGVQSHFQVFIRAKRGVSYMGDIAVDDISFENCAALLIPARQCSSDEYSCTNKYCIPKEQLCDFTNDCADHSDELPLICSTNLGHCDFEFDLCSWRQWRNDNFDWILKEGSIPTLGTSPTTDHTLRTPAGHYIYIESPFPHLPGHMARLSGPSISKISKDCKIIFYYHMAGNINGSLTVYLQTLSGHHTSLLNLTGDRGHYWQRAGITLSADEDFEIMIEGWVGKGSKGVIALDDITFTKGCIISNNAFYETPTPHPPTGSCPPNYLACQNGRCYHTEQSCDFLDDCGDNTDEKECGTSCTFENGQCGWKNSLADNFDWILGQGSFQDLRPASDRNLGNEHGHFLYLEAIPGGLRGDKVHLRSSVWKESSAKCTLSFWYYMSQKATGLIRVLIETSKDLTEVWNKTGNQGDRWNKAMIHLKNLRNFEIIIEGIRTKNFGGGAAIDDIQFKHCAPDRDLLGICPDITDYVCQNGECIESDLVCDYKLDCEDGSDESNCSQYVNIAGSCSFSGPNEGSLISNCRLMQNNDDNFDWSIGDKNFTVGTSPATDHTPGVGGMFLYINSSAQHEGDIARITTTHSFPASIGVCHLRFWYFISASKEMGSLKVYTAGKSGMPLLMWSVSGNNEDNWMYASLMVANNHPFQVVFEAEVGGDKHITIAIDDISFTLGCVSGELPVPLPATCSPVSFQCWHTQMCIYQSWVCDGEEDCADGSDESNCSTLIPGTFPPQDQCEDTEFQCSNGECIPSLFRCDAVPDCPSKEDEFGCSATHCFNGSLFCASSGECIPVTQRCDGNVDCRDFKSDESSCSECPNAYCRNGGTCIIVNRTALCKCTSQWKGNRCHILVNTAGTLSPDLAPDNDSMWAGLGTGLGLFVLTLLIVSIIITKRKASKVSASKTKCVSISNILYGDHSANLSAEFTMEDTLTSSAISVYPWQTPCKVFSRVSNKLTSFSNPLYDGKLENWKPAEETPGNLNFRNT